MSVCCSCDGDQKPLVLALKLIPKPKLESEPDSEREYDSEPESKPKSEPDPTRQPDSEPNAASESQPDSALQNYPQPTAASEPEPDAGRQADLEPVAASEPEPDPERNPDREPTPVDLPLDRESDPMQRYTRAAFNKHNASKLIQGYQNAPIVSLEEALKPITKTFGDISNKIKIAERDCCYPSFHHLTRDESAAIYIYSMKGENNLYSYLQEAWNSWDSSQLKPWFKYLKLLKSALDKLPDVNKQIWQRIGRNEEHEKTLKKDQSQLYTCMSSCWPLYEDAAHDLKQESVSKTIFVGYEFVNGKDVTDYTEGRIKEVMIWPGAKIYVMKVVDDEEDGSTRAYIKRLYVPTHFVCPMNACTNYCNGDHNTNHCRGFAYVVHTCSHHCGPTYRCYVCKQHASKLHQCSMCGWRFCRLCCFQDSE